jgi:sec-independent protein translocase protein TatB
MFDIGWGELLLIGIVALIAIGPKELPGALRTLGQWMAKLRRMASEFQNQFQEAMREAEMADLKKQVDDLTSQAQSYANFDPIGDVRKELEGTQQQIESAITTEPTANAPPTPAETAAVEASAAPPALPSAETPPALPSADTLPDAPSPAAAPTSVDAVADKGDAGGKAA